MTRDVVISLFDLTGNMVEPWREAGYECWVVDLQHPPAFADGGITRPKDNLVMVHRDLSMPWLLPIERKRIAFMAAFPPCDHLSVSGARWFKGKGLRAFQGSVALFATAAEMCEWSGAPYCIENPVSTMSTYWRQPDHMFDPHQFSGYEADDNYTKRTCLWTGGGFVMPEHFVDPTAGTPDDRIWKAGPSPERKNMRGATPLGFARAVFAANHMGEDDEVTAVTEAGSGVEATAGRLADIA